MVEADYEVVVVGAGLVGLTAALALARAGVGTVVVEAHRDTHEHPRARGVNARAMEIFRELGVAGEIRRAGAPLAASRGVHQGTSLAEIVGPMQRRRPGKTANPPSPLSPELVTAIGPERGGLGTLDVVEPILLAAARRHGAHIRFATRCRSLEEDPDGVVVHLSTEDDAPEVVRARYVIDAEGAGGRLRDMLGVGVATGHSHGHALNVLFTADLRGVRAGRGHRPQRRPTALPPGLRLNSRCRLLESTARILVADSSSQEPGYGNQRRCPWRAARSALKILVGRPPDAVAL